MENKIEIHNMNLHYGDFHALHDINLDIKENEITAFIGPSGCGKSTLLRSLNRMNDLVPNVTINGKVWIDGEDIYDPKVDTTLLRKKVGMVFQNFNLFNNMTVLKNCTVGQEKVLKKSKEEAHRNAMMYLAALVIGTIVSTALLGLLKKKVA